MSLSCSITVYNPDSEPFKPTQRVSGVIRYTAYEYIALRKIVISLKGNGTLDLLGKTKRKFRENYVMMDKIIQESSTSFILEPGTYEETFSFILPKQIPSSIKTKMTTLRHKVRCNIQYYIRIKFDRGCLKSEKTFKKNIAVYSTVQPRLPSEPAKYKMEKTYKGMISDLIGVIRIKAIVENSVIHAGDKIVIHYSLKNFSNSILSGVVTKLVEVYSFKPNRPLIKSKFYQDIESTISTSTTVSFGDIFLNTVEIQVPENLNTIEYSTLVCREYFVKITISLPFPHANIVVKMPVQIINKQIEGRNLPFDYVEEINYGEIDDMNNEEIVGDDISDDASPSYLPPPSYWETMGQEVPGSPNGEDER